MVIRNLSDKSLVSAVDVSAVKPNNMYIVDNDIIIFKVTSQNRRFAIQVLNPPMSLSMKI